jgi:hypothetical protein
MVGKVAIWCPNSGLKKGLLSFNSIDLFEKVLMGFV